MEGVSACSTSVSSLNHTASDKNKSSASFYSRNTCEVSVESSQLKIKDTEKKLEYKFNQRKLQKKVREGDQQIKKKLEDIILNKFGISIPSHDCSKSKLLQITINIINKIESGVNPFRIHYKLDFFRRNNFQLNQAIKGKKLSPDQVIRRKLELLLNVIKETLNVNSKRGSSYSQILSAACDYLNDYLKHTSTSMEESGKSAVELTSILPPDTLPSFDDVMAYHTHDNYRNEIGCGLENRVLVSSVDQFELGAIESTYSSSLSPFYHSDSVAANASANFIGLSISQVPADSVQVKKDNSKKIKRNKELRIKENRLTKELEEVLIGKFGITIIGLGCSKNKLISATSFIIEQIKSQVEPINLLYDIDHYQEKSRQFVSLIKQKGLSDHQVFRRKRDFLLNELKELLDIDVDMCATKESIHEKILSEACNYLNGYLNQTSETTLTSDDSVMYFPSSIQPDELQLLTQNSIPLTNLPIEEELTKEEQLSLIRLKMALDKYPIPQIENGNFSELLFAAAYCMKMNSNIMQVSELDYNQHYVKNFHAPYPYNNPRDEIKDHLDDLEKAISEESMNLAIKQCLNHQKDTLPETSDLENTGLDSLMDTFDPEALFTTGSLNHTLGHGESDTDSAQVQKITAALNLAAEYLENEEYLKLQNSLAHEQLIENEPVAKKIKVQ